MKRPADHDASEGPTGDRTGVAPPAVPPCNAAAQVTIKREGAAPQAVPPCAAAAQAKREGAAPPAVPLPPKEGAGADAEGDLEMEDKAPAGATAPPSGAPLPAPAANQIVRTTVLVKSNPRKGAARDAIFAVPWQPADVERLESPVARRAVVQISPQILVEHAGGARRTLRAFNVFDFDVPNIRFPEALEGGSLGREQLKNAKKEYLAGVLARCETLAQYWTEVPEILGVARRARDFARALQARGVAVLVVFSGLKGFHVYVRDADLVAAVEGPGAAVYAKEDLDQWWGIVRAKLKRLEEDSAAALRDPSVPQGEKSRLRRSFWSKATRAAGPRRVPGMYKAGRWEGREAFERVVVPFAEERGIGAMVEQLEREGVLDLAPFRVNSGCRSDEHRHGWTSYYPVAVPLEAVDDAAIAATVRLHATRPDPLLVAWNSDEWRWLRELAREIAPKHTLHVAAPADGARPPPPKRPRAPPGPRPPPTLDREGEKEEEEEEGGNAEDGDAEDEATISEGVVERLGLLAMWVAESGIPGVLAATAHCYSLRCAGEPLLGALAWAQPGAFGGASTLAQADAALLGLHATRRRRQRRRQRGGGRGTGPQDGARGAAPAPAAPALPQRPAGALPPVRVASHVEGRSYFVRVPCWSCGHRKGKLFIDQTSGEAEERGQVRVRACGAAACGGRWACGPLELGEDDATELRLAEDEVDMFSLRLFPEQAKSMGAGTFGATARNPYWAELPQGAVDYLDAVVAWLRTLGAGAALPSDGGPERRVRPRGVGPPGSFPLEDGATGGPAARLRAMLPDLATWRAALRLPELSRPLAIPADFDPVARRWIDIDEPAGPGAQRFCSPAPILARLDGGRKTIFVRAETGSGKTETCVGGREGAAGPGPRGILQAVLDDPTLVGLPSVPGAPPRVLYVTAGRVQPDILVKDPRFAALSYPSASGERVPVAWTVYKEARPRSSPTPRARALTTLTTGGPFKGPEHHAQTVAWFDRALEAPALVIVADADLLDEDAALYAARRPGADVISYLKRGSNDARLRWTAIDIRYAAAVIAAKLLAGEVGYIACSTRRALWEIESIVRRHMRLSGRRCEFLYADADRRARQTMTDSDYVCSALCYASNYAMPQGTDFSSGPPANFVAYIEEGRTADVNAGFQLVRRRRHVIGPDAFFFCRFPRKAPLPDRQGRPLHAPVDWRAIYGELVDSVRAWNERLPAERRVATEEHYLRVRAVRTALRNATHACPMLAFHLKLRSLGNEGLYVYPCPSPEEAQGRRARGPERAGGAGGGGLPWMPEGYSDSAVPWRPRSRRASGSSPSSPRRGCWATTAPRRSGGHGREKAAARFGLRPEQVGVAEVRLSEQSPPAEIFRLSKRFALDTLPYLASGAAPDEESATLLPDHRERRRPFESALRLFELLGARVPPGGGAAAAASDVAAGLRYLFWATWEGPEDCGAARLRGLGEAIEEGGIFTDGPLGRLFADACRAAWERIAIPYSPIAAYRADALRWQCAELWQLECLRPEKRNKGAAPPPIGDCARRLLHDLVVHAAEQLGLGVLVAAADARRVVRGGARRTVKRTRYCFDPETVLLGLRLYGRDRDGRGDVPPDATLGALLAAGVRSLQIALVQDPKSKLRAAGAGGGGGEGGEGGAPGAPAEAGARPRPSDAAQRVFRLLKSGVHSAVFFSQAARAVLGEDAARCWRGAGDGEEEGDGASRASPYAEVLARAAASEAPEALAPIAPPLGAGADPTVAALCARDLARAALAMDDGAARDGLGFPAAEESPALPTEDATWLLCRLAEAAGAPAQRASEWCPIVEGREGPDPCVGFAYTSIFARDLPQERRTLPSSGIDVARTGSDTSGISLFVDGAARLLPEDLARPRVARGPRSCGAKMLLFVPRSTFQHFGVPLLALPPRPAPAPTPAPPA
eukprot:tig00021045_g17657.t1